VLKGIEYNSSTKGKCENTNEIVTTGSTENCESENDKKVSFDNVTNEWICILRILLLWNSCTQSVLVCSWSQFH